MKVSLSVGRKNDMRFKISKSQAQRIKKLFETGLYNKTYLANLFKVSRATIRYYVDPEYRRGQQAKNAQRRKTEKEERRQLRNQKRRRDLIINKYRAYNRLANKKYRAKNLSRLRKYQRDWYRRKAEMKRKLKKETT